MLDRITNKPINQIKAGAALNYVTILLSTLVGLLYTPFMLRMMGQSEYGLYSLVASIIGYLTILDLGFGNAIVRYTAKFRAQGKIQEQYEMFGMFFVLYVFIGLISVVLGAVLYNNVELMFGKSMTPEEVGKAKIMVRILILNLAVTFPMSLFGSIMTAYEKFVFPKIISIIRLILNTFVMIALLKNGYKAIAMCVVQTFFNFTTLFINYIYCRYQIKIKVVFRKFNFGFLKEIAVYSFWILLNVIMDKIYWNTGQFVLGAVSGTVAVAIFSVAIHLHSMYMQFSTSISSVFLPRVTSMVIKEATEEAISDLFIRTGRIQYSIMGFILAGFIVFGRQFINLWAGPDYGESYIITLIFYVSLLIPLIQSLGITILQARNQMKFRSILYIVIAAVSLVLQIIFSRLWGGVGCAIAIAGALLIGQGVIMNIYYNNKQHINIKLFWKQILKMMIIPAIIISLSLFVLQYVTIDSWAELLGGIVSFFIIYLPLFYLFSLNNYEKNMISSFFRRTIKK